jgi:hypothetical protein
LAGRSDLFRQTPRRQRRLTHALIRRNTGIPARESIHKGESVSTPDHAENTGDNLRHAAEVQEQAQDDKTETQVPDEDSAPATPLPDFNT